MDHVHHSRSTLFTTTTTLATTTGATTTATREPTPPLVDQHKAAGMEREQKREPQGYLLALHYSDQMTGSTVNLVDFQCWAKHETKHSNVVVVEPFIVQSWYGTSMKIGEEGTKQNAIRVSDIFDFDVWRQFTVEQKGYVPIVSWEHFLSNAPRDLIIASQPPLQDCDMEALAKQVTPFAEEHSFKIVRKACFYFHKSGLLTSEQFYSNLYGDYSPENVTVLFDRWGGINRGGDPWTMGIRDSPCQRQWDDAKFVSKKSKTISGDVERYIATHLNGSRNYVSVNIRFQFYYANHNLNSASLEKKSTELESLIQCVVAEWRSLKEKHPIQNTLITTDYGKHGSKTLQPENNELSLEEKVKELFNSIYGTPTSWDRMEEEFKAIASIKIPGYIAIMQQELVAQAEYLILAGGGGRSKFQQQTKHVFTTYHSGSTDHLLEVCK